ncbi:hypothetical protein FHR81_001346 [Actinoalloteichus hoggarensis]|uniref:Uncharacterized protein n=1 Tax=Actinoalloteichus hoggarensis TaxID=1470176 RepID=A0A221W014_9PSEU|nr:hypothetical protein AHOG_07150 [Actinoalloteichus hoggarensis]MBB5920316.1 hypothetical protein [Actinoalloteichus hoggarensis]
MSPPEWIGTAWSGTVTGTVTGGPAAAFGA